MKNIADKTFDKIDIGDSAMFRRTITAKDMSEFARLSGDMNPLHLDAKYAASTKFKKRIAHGMFLGALCSRLVGVYLPGRRCLYLSQDLIFKKPVYIGDTVVVAGKVKHRSAATKIIEVAIEIRNKKQLAAYGTAKVQIL